MASKRPELSLLAQSNYDHSTTSTESASSVTSYSSSIVANASTCNSSSAGTSSIHSNSSSSDDSSSASSELDDTNRAFYKSAHWTHDGTTIITSSWDNKICSFVVPEDLLEPRHQPLELSSHRTLQLATPTNVVASAPYYDIRYPNTDHLLVASRDHPLQLYQTGPLPRATPEDDGHPPESHDGRNGPISSYHFTSPTTEAYYPIHSLVWPSPGIHFYVGTRDFIAQFDVTRNGDGPSSLIHTIPSRRHIRKGNGIGMRGTVSALSAQTTADNVPTGLIAAGTWTRWVGLYDIARSGECTATWGIQKAAEQVRHTDALTAPPGHTPLPTAWTSVQGRAHACRGIGGAGIMQTAWSPCGRYLLLNERCSTGMLVYDVRGTNRVLGFLAGRDARTQQRMSCDVFRGLARVGGFEVWAGAMDGTVKVWEGVGNTAGCQWPSWGFSAADGADGLPEAVAPALGSVGLHHSGSVVATCAGSAALPGEVTSPPSCRMEASSLKLWRIGASAAPDEEQAAGEPEHVKTPMGGADDLEQHRRRVLATLRTDETDGPEPVHEPVAEAEGVHEIQSHEAAGPEPMDLSAVEAGGLDHSQDQKGPGLSPLEPSHFNTGLVREPQEPAETTQANHAEHMENLAESGDGLGLSDLPQSNPEAIL